MVLAVWFIARRRRQQDIVRRWGLDPASCRVLASGLARHMSRPSLVADGLVGSPDALMRERAEGTIIVGEAFRAFMSSCSSAATSVKPAITHSRSACPFEPGSSCACSYRVSSMRVRAMTWASSSCSSLERLDLDKAVDVIA